MSEPEPKAQQDDLEAAWGYMTPPRDEPLRAIAIAILDIAASLRGMKGPKGADDSAG